MAYNMVTIVPLSCSANVVGAHQRGFVYGARHGNSAPQDNHSYCRLVKELRGLFRFIVFPRLYDITY